MWKTGSSLKRRLNMLLVVCLIPLTIMIFYLIILVDRFSERYDVVVEKITMANAYNLTLKEDIDYIMYVVVVNSERAQEIVDTTRPHTIIAKARQVFGNLYEKAEFCDVSIPLRTVSGRLRRTPWSAAPMKRIW